MLYTFLTAIIRIHFLIEQLNIATILTITGFIFVVLLLIGVRKYFKLKIENKQSSNSANLQSKEDNKVYKDFTEGHLYDSY